MPDSESNYFELNDNNIFERFPFLQTRLNNSPHPRNYLIELTQDITNSFLSNNLVNTVDPAIQINDVYFFFHPWLNNFCGSSNALIQNLCLYRRKYPNQAIEIALDPYRYKHSIESTETRLERITGICYNIEKIIEKLNTTRRPIISVFFDPNLPDPDIISDPNEKIIALERFLNFKTGFPRWPIRVVIDFLNRDHDEIEFNIYEFSNIRISSGIICRSLHSIYYIQSNRFIHIDGKVLNFEPANYYPRILAFQTFSRKPAYKLFRLDGVVPEGIFVKICTTFFYYNDIILEFFEMDNLQEYLEQDEDDN